MSDIEAIQDPHKIKQVNINMDGVGVTTVQICFMSCWQLMAAKER